MFLQEFINEYIKNTSDDKCFKDSGNEQMLFVRDKISSLLGAAADVVSTHSSKSIDLPVYKFITNDFEIYLCNNFYDWKVSVSMMRGLPHKFIDLVSKLCAIGLKEDIDSCYCEGFKIEWVYPYLQSKFIRYDEDDIKSKGEYLTNKKFTIQVNNNYSLYTFLFILVNFKKA